MIRHKKKEKICYTIYGYRCIPIKLYNLAAEEISDVSSLLRSFKNNNYDTELADIKENLTEYRKESRELSKEKKDNTTDKKEVDKMVISLTKKLKKVDNSALNISELEEEKVRLSDGLSDVDTKVGELKTLSEQYKVEETELTEKINIYKENEIDKKFAQLEQYTLEKTNNQIEIDKLKIEVQNKLDKINKLGNLEYDTDCEYC